MGTKNKNLILYVTLCSILGVVFGATASQAEIDQCLTAETPANSCLNKNPVMHRLEGMGMGLFAGAGAAIGATWKLGQKQ